MIIMNKKITFVSLESRMATENGRRSRQNWNLKQLSIYYLCHSVSQSLSQAFRHSILQLLRHSVTQALQLFSYSVILYSPQVTQSLSYSVTQLRSHSVTQSFSQSVNHKCNIFLANTIQQSTLLGFFFTVIVINCTFKHNLFCSLTPIIWHTLKMFSF